MKIFIAGATGTLGIPLVKELACQGHEVTGLARTEDKARMLTDLGVNAAVADALDRAALADAVRKAGPEIVIDVLTAIPKRCPMRSEDMIATNRLRVPGTDNLLAAAIAARARRIVAESMIFVHGYGDHGPDKLTETEELRPEQILPVRETVGALRYMEDRLFAANRKGLIESVVLRFGLLYGPDVPATRSNLQMVLARKLPVLTRGDGSKGWIHIDDAVSAIVAAVGKGRPGGIYNIVDDAPSSYRDFILFAAQMLGAPRPRSVPLWFLRLRSAYFAAALSTRLLVSNEKAKNELGWQPEFPDYRAGLQSLATGYVIGKKAA